MRWAGWRQILIDNLQRPTLSLASVLVNPAVKVDQVRLFQMMFLLPLLPLLVRCAVIGAGVVGDNVAELRRACQQCRRTGRVRSLPTMNQVGVMRQDHAAAVEEVAEKGTAERLRSWDPMMDLQMGPCVAMPLTLARVSTVVEVEDGVVLAAGRSDRDLAGIGGRGSYQG
mmetsp:Transcript_17690/g.32073  ORF Transcript_17690/g.32073 Transcript_17690/m.32073 type:complete len:170 (+) Transcript_17690:57-566(+)